MKPLTHQEALNKIHAIISDVNAVIGSLPAVFGLDEYGETYDGSRMRHGIEARRAQRSRRRMYCALSQLRKVSEEIRTAYRRELKPKDTKGGAS